MSENHIDSVWRDRMMYQHIRNVVARHRYEDRQHQPDTSEHRILGGITLFCIIVTVVSIWAALQ